MPFVFANEAGAPRNALTIAHERGHAFHLYNLQHHKALDLIIPTDEMSEIHSLRLLPYIAAIDHFHEAVCERPEASVEDRRSIWLEMDAFYTPWQTWGYSRVASWQAQRHVYRFQILVRAGIISPFKRGTLTTWRLRQHISSDARSSAPRRREAVPAIPRFLRELRARAEALEMSPRGRPTLQLWKVVRLVTTR